MELLANRTGAITIFSNPREWFSTHLLNIIVIIIGAWAIRRISVAVIMGILKRVVRTHRFASESDRKKRIATLDSLLSTASKIAVWSIATIMIVDELGINTAPLLASIGIVGVAVGIGSQSLIKDFTNGLFIILENQYRVGDPVSFGTASGTVQATGTVQSISVRTTVLRDINGNIHHVPNGTIIVTTNKTFDLSGINEDITVRFNTDIPKLEKIINKIGVDLSEDEVFGKKIKKAPYMAQVASFSDQGIVIKILGDTTPGTNTKVRTELFKRLQEAFIKEKITPFLQASEDIS
jgi:moderate conductance mechanosensitive channel